MSNVRKMSPSGDHPTQRRPLVTMALLTYNNARNVLPAFQSLQAQDYPNLEILIHDDASSDDTIELCRRHAEGDHRVRFKKNIRNLGAWNNLAAAAEDARGEYMCWACAGDCWDPNYVTVLVERLMARPGAVAAQSAVERIDEQTRERIAVHSMGHNAKPDRLNSWQRAWRSLIKVSGNGGGTRYSHFLHGVVKTDAMRKTLRAFPRPVDMLNERIVVSHWGMAGPFVTVEEPLIHREIHRHTQGIRAPHDPTLKGRNDPQVLRLLVRLAHQFGTTVARTDLLSTPQKAKMATIASGYLLVVAAHFALIGTVSGMRRVLPTGVYAALRSWYRHGRTRFRGLR